MSRVITIKQVVKVQDTTGRALEMMDASDSDFLPVVGVGTGRLLGVVLRKGIEWGCVAMGHDPGSCPVQNHLKTKVDSVYEDEMPDPNAVPAGAQGPILVIDRERRPVGALLPDE